MQRRNSGNLVSNPVSYLWRSASGTKLLAFLCHEIFSKTSAIQATVLALKNVTNTTQLLLPSVPVSTLKLLERYKQSSTVFPVSGFVDKGISKTLSGSTRYPMNSCSSQMMAIMAALSPACAMCAIQWPTQLSFFTDKNSEKISKPHLVTWVKMLSV